MGRFKLFMQKEWMSGSEKDGGCIVALIWGRNWILWELEFQWRA